MRVLFALVLGMAVGAAALFFYTNYRHDPRLQSAGQKVGDAAQNEIQSLHLRPEDIKEELARSGQVVRRAATQAGQAIADATADARTTGAIKTKLVASRELSALNISVNTTGGIVTLSGYVSSAEDISKAVLLAMQTSGVREVISTLQVKPPAK